MPICNIVPFLPTRGKLSNFCYDIHQPNHKEKDCIHIPWLTLSCLNQVMMMPEVLKLNSWITHHKWNSKKASSDNLIFISFCLGPDLPSSSSNGFVDLLSLNGFLSSSSSSSSSLLLWKGFLSSSRKGFFPTSSKNGLVLFELLTVVNSPVTSVSPWPTSCSNFSLKFFLHSSILSSHSFYRKKCFQCWQFACKLERQSNTKQLWSLQNAEICMVFSITY